MLQPLVSARPSPRKAVRAALLLGAVHGNHARRHDLDTREQARDPLLPHRRAVRPQLLRDHACVQRECDATHTHEGALREQLVDPHACDREVPWLHVRNRIAQGRRLGLDRKSTRLNSSHLVISYAVFCLKKKKKRKQTDTASADLMYSSTISEVDTSCA